MNGDEGAPETCLRDCPILVVDDAEFNRTIIGAMLEDAGYRDIRYARSGAEALDAVETHPPDLVLLDIMMPGIDGFEVCRRVRANFDSADLPILVQTALSSMDDRNRAFEVGATDLVAKPIERHELLARVRIHLENRVLIRRQRAYRERVEGELAIAKGMFDHLSPTPLQCEWIRQTTGMTVRSCARLSSRLGGAAWGITPLAHGRVGIYMLDVAGQGLAAALNAFRLHTLVHELKDLGDMPAALLTALNARAAALLDADDRASLLFGVLDAGAETFTYAAAGVLVPRLARPGADRLIEGERGGEEIGVCGDAIYRSRRIDIAPGDVLTLENRFLGSEEASAGDLMAAAALDAEGDAGAFGRLAACVDGLAAEAFDDDYLAVWLDRSASDDVVLAEGA